MMCEKLYKKIHDGKDELKIRPEEADTFERGCEDPGSEGEHLEIPTMK